MGLIFVCLFGIVAMVLLDLEWMFVPAIFVFVLGVLFVYTPIGWLVISGFCLYKLLTEYSDTQS